MKIVVLEHPRIASAEYFNDIANAPLWSCLMGGYAAASLERDDHEVLFLDHAGAGTTFAETLGEIEKGSPQLLCVNAVYFWEHSRALFEFFDDLRVQGFAGHINLFGFFASLVYDRILEGCQVVDSIAVGEFEQTLCELARGLSEGRPLEGVRGLAIRSATGSLHFVARLPEKDPDIFPFPKRVNFPDTLSVLASRGCYSHCSFCPVPSFYNQGPLWRGRSPENILAEMEILVGQGAESFYFCDPNFIGPGLKGRQRIVRLMEMIEPLHIHFGMETRPQDLDAKVLEKMTQAGFTSLLMGVESGSDAVLQRIDKASGIEVASRAIRLCRQYGIEPEIGFLMFIHNSTVGDLRANLSFLLDNNLLDRLERTANLLSHVQIVLAGTSGYRRLAQHGGLEDIGMFGFQARAPFTDPAVEWVANRLVYACRLLLKETGRPDSPLYWQKADQRVSASANVYLVNLAQRLLSGEMKIENHEGLVHDREYIRLQVKEILEM